MVMLQEAASKALELPGIMDPSWVLLWRSLLFRDPRANSLLCLGHIGMFA